MCVRTRALALYVVGRQCASCGVRCVRCVRCALNIVRCALCVARPYHPLTPSQGLGSL